MSSNAPIAQFLGGVRTVTGSKTLLEVGGDRMLIDCGLFQGRKELRRANWTDFPVPPRDIHAVVLTHAHLDHCGYLPRLVRHGFDGPVYCTPGTAELARIVLPDSAHLQEEEASYANRVGYSQHRPAEPLYNAADADAALALLETVPFGTRFEPIVGVGVRFRRAGHILGAATLALDVGSKRVAFSGDLGRPTHPLLVPPDPIDGADLVVTESTYGDEEHLDVDPSDAIAAAINAAVDRGGAIIVPAFAVDRTEMVLWHLDRLVAANRIPHMPIYVDSPMACRALDVYEREIAAGSSELRRELGRPLFGAIHVQQTHSVDESKALNDLRGPAVIVSASGMATGGRVVHHLAHRIGDSRTTVLLVGFQAPGTRGDSLRRGATTIKLLGEHHPVRAHVTAVDLSSHADRSELLDWLATAGDPRVIYVNHGEEDASQALAGEIVKQLGVAAVIPQRGERVRLA